MRVTELNYVTCEYGVKGSWAAGYHPGVDYRAAVGTPVFAAKRGKVIHSGWGGWGEAYGDHVIIESWHGGRKIRHIYAHLSNSQAVVGKKVKDAQQIGLSGETGNTFGPHVHFEERVSPFGYWNHRRPLLLAWQPGNKKRLANLLEKMGVKK